ncbi:MAG: hypothetical protein WCL16_11705, partial [bacterium]
MSTKASIFTGVLLVAGLFLSVVWSARAEDNTTSNITTTVDNGGAVYYVGHTGTNNMLAISGGGVLTNVAYGYIGASNGANHNAVTVTGTNSLWSNSGFVSVGYSGASNTLTIANGGKVCNSNAYIGCYSTASNNTLTVTGSGSVWN